MAGFWDLLALVTGRKSASPVVAVDEYLEIEGAETGYQTAIGTESGYQETTGTEQGYMKITGAT